MISSPKPSGVSPLAATMIYLVVGIAWILLTDRLMDSLLTLDHDTGVMFSSFKGMLFVALTSILVYLLTAGAARSQRRNSALVFNREAELRDLIDTLPVPLIVVRRADGMVRHGNSWAESLCRLEAGGRSNDIFIDSDERMPFLLCIDPSPKAAPQDVRFRDREGAAASAALSVRPFAFGGEDCLVVSMIDITAHKRAEAQLHRKHEVLQGLLRLQEQFIGDRDAQALFQRLLKVSLQLTGSVNGVIVENASEGAAETRAGIAWDRAAEGLARVQGNGAPLIEPDLMVVPLHAGGALRGVIALAGRVEAYDLALFDELAAYFHSCGNLISAFRSEQRREEAEATLSKLSLAVEQSPTSVIITDRQGAIEYVNQRFTEVSGYSPAEVLGKTPRVLKSGYMPEVTYTELWETVLGGHDWHGELYNKRKDGELYWSLTQISPIRGRDGSVTHMVSMGDDISQRKRHEERLLQQANFDQLTNLPNRILAFDRVTQALNQAQRDQRPLTLLQVDLDHFKLVNESLGHTIGDAVLVESAQRLLACVRKTDTVARLSSDEFLVVLADRANDEQSDLVARRVLEAFSHPFEVGPKELFVSVSVGLTVAPSDGLDPNILLRNCATAMNRAKELGRNTYCFFTPGMNKTAAERMEIDGHLRHALERDELFLTFQPLQDLATGRLVGAEALLRWNSPALGLVMPDRFIPLAEESGLIVPIGEWILRDACVRAKAWLDRGLDITLAVNTSSRQLRGNRLVEVVREVLAETGLPPGNLEMEITESFLIEDPQGTAAILEQLHGLGVRLSLDDFGTGYSSLSYLKRFPFHTLKIDRSFVRDVMSDPSDRALVQAIIAMARSLNLKIIAEGVETEDQQNFLRELGCDILQGYLYSHPLVPAQFEVFAGIGI